LANGNGRDRIALGVTDCERATLARHSALSAVYSSHINRTGPMLIHAAAAIQILDNAGLTLNEMIEFWGSLLIVERAGNGDRWYNRQQVEAFAA
jgi:hypothetical protein